MCGVGPRQQASITEMLAKLKWPTLEARRHDQRLTLMYKVVHGLVAVTPDDLDIENADGRTRRTHRHKFREKRARTDDCKFSFTNHTIPEWNKLPAELAEAGSFNIFKGRLAAHLD